MTVIDHKNSEASGESLILPLPTFLPRRYRPGSLANWSGHLAFANDLIAECRPSLLVELGTHYGESYFGMCQSVLGNGVDCVCYAVDHWSGEEHAGQYGEEVFAEVNEYNDRSYKSFSYLLRCAFDDALPQFADNTIDLLHIDGLHTYEAGSHDFQSWLPKVKEGGVILFHDVMVRHANFGIWKLWGEIEHEFSETFAFHHSWGLGVLRKPGNTSQNCSFLDSLFASSGQTSERIRRHYVLYASYQDRLLVTAAEPALVSSRLAEPVPPSDSESTNFQVFSTLDGSYSEAESLRHTLQAGEWNNLSFEFASGVAGALRIDPADRPCILELGVIKVIEASSGEMIWSAGTASELKALNCIRSVFLPQSPECFLFSYLSDPQIYLPLFKQESRIRLEVSVRLQSGFDLLSQALIFAPPVAEIHEAQVPASIPEWVPPPAVRSSGLPKDFLVQVYPFNASGYVEADSVVVLAETGRWTTVSLELPEGSLNGPIRIDPSDTCSVVDIGEIKIIDLLTGSVMLDLRESHDLRRLTILDAAMYLPQTDHCSLFCFSDDPKLQFSTEVKAEGPIRIDISLKVDVELDQLAKILKDVSESPSVFDAKEYAREIDTLTRDTETLKAELKASQATRLLMAAEISQIATERNSAFRAKEEALDKAKFRSERESADRARLSELIDTANAEKALALASRDAALAAAERAVAFSDQATAASAEASIARDTAVHERNLAAAALAEALALRDQALISKDQALASRDQAIASTHRAIAEKEEAIHSRNLTALAAASIKADLVRERQVIRSVETSVSWRLTSPLRSIMHAFRGSRNNISSGDNA